MYIPLRNHTPYSLLEGSIPLAALLDHAENRGLPALGLADSGHLFGAMEFSLACQKRGIQPIIGCTLSVIFDGATQPARMPLYAANAQGYRHLCRLVTCTTVGQTAALRGCVSQEQLLSHAPGLIVLTGGEDGALDPLIQQGQTDRAWNRLQQLKAAFGDRLYIELMRLEAVAEETNVPEMPGGGVHDIDRLDRSASVLLEVGGDGAIVQGSRQFPQESCTVTGKRNARARGVDAQVPQGRLVCENTLIEWAFDAHIPLVATNPALFLTPEDYEPHDALRCIALGRYVMEEDRPRVSPYCYFRSTTEMQDLFADVPEALENTAHIMRRCGFLLRAQAPALPSYFSGPAFLSTEVSNAADGDQSHGGAKGTDLGLAKGESLAQGSHIAVMAASAPSMPEPLVVEDTVQDFVHPHDTPEEYEFRRQCWEGLAVRLRTMVLVHIPCDQHEAVRQNYRDRLAYECAMIIQMGFAGYFLIVSDFIRWAKKQDIPVGPGRGSGAGSLAAWCLHITDVDPVKFHLFFERFLNPERVSMPDFDVDFCQERRDEVIAYVRDRYGADRVAHIITFGSLQARAVLRDVGRVLQMPYMQVDRLCKMVPNNPAHPVTLAQALVLEPQLQAAADEDETVKKLLDVAQKLEGLYRHASVHAAGVIISQGPLCDVVPLYQDEGSALPATEFSMKYVESAGLVKFDFLGLKTLTVLQTAIKLLACREVHLDLAHIPLDDAPTFALLCRAETVGLFQLESAGMTDVLRQLQPASFNEIIALVALYRPGPMDDIPRYIACRHGREPITYAYDCLEPILQESFGVMVYQEQVLQIARVLAGYTMGGADLLRRAMGKKIKSEMDAQRKIFVQGVVEKYPGTQEMASQLFDQIAKFAGYAFPKAHATPYALIAYQTAYIKANFPTEFLTALMIHDTHNTDKIAGFVREGQRLGIRVSLPDINASQAAFSVQDAHKIRYGLAALKGVGAGVSEKIVQARHQDGLFLDIGDFLRRTVGLGVNKKTVESLICAGAFETLHPGQRACLMASVDRLLRQANSAQQASSVPMGSLFSGSASGVDRTPCVLQDTPAWSPYEALAHELQAIGFYLSGHPLDPYRVPGIVLWQEVQQTATAQEHNVTLMGMVMDVTEKISKSGKKYAFVQVSDPSGTYEFVMFADKLTQHRSLLVPGTAIALTAKIKRVDEVVKVWTQDIRPLQEQRESQSLMVCLRDWHSVQTLGQALHQAPRGSIRLSGTVLLPQGDPKASRSLCVHFSLPHGYSLNQRLRTILAALVSQDEKN